MSAKTYGVIIRVMAFALGAFIAAGIVLVFPVYLPLIVIMAAVVVSNILRRSVKEITADERTRLIDEKAAAFTYRLYSVITALSVLIVLLLRNSLPQWAADAGQAVAYFLCGLLLIHLAATKYFQRKL